jgi:hypothetical protein
MRKLFFLYVYDSGSQITLSLQFFGHGTEFIVPCLTKTADKRSLKKTIDRQMELTALLAGGATDGPLMIVQSHGSIGKSLFADRIEGATDGLAESGLSIPVCLL